MLTLALFLLTLALTLAAAWHLATDPLPQTVPAPAPAIPVAALGLTWRRAREVGTRNGPRVLWVGDGDASRYSRAYRLARKSLRSVGYSWGKEERDRGMTVPVCWEDRSVPEGFVWKALAEAEEALAADDAKAAKAEAQRLRDAELEAVLSGDARREDMAALRRSLDVLHWAWSKRKRELAESLFREPKDAGGAPRAHVAKLARDLVVEVDCAIERVRQRVARDPAHDWLTAAQDEGVRHCVHAATRYLSSLDEDRATVQNDAGWGKSHSHAGHVLAAERELNVIQASHALAAVWRHRRQIPEALRLGCFGREGM
ncbi:hypothetical protein [Methylobacterium iners]|uniref:Uncharacterized protein n=1 Tax=Methylobacterium iners TaxID=418707 RepID=A0ABQ4S2X2_9HYPH|nr:hypothetical protein [Methylobacterium iners]GJD97490.1 hypothetical protein OCOJLMKI_4721 [Methylobacterium iners]